MAASSSAKSSHLEPLRVLPERRLPADWSLPGHWPARGEVPRGREPGHVGADLSDHRFGTAALDADGCAQQLNRRRERADLLLDRVRESVDLRIEEVDVREDRADPERVMGVEATFQRLAQRRDLLAHLPARELREYLRVGGSTNERVEHVAARLAEDVRRDAIELDARVL